MTKTNTKPKRKERVAKPMTQNVDLRGWLKENGRPKWTKEAKARASKAERDFSKE